MTSRQIMNSLTLVSMASHEATTQIQPKSAVRKMNSRLMPSTPREYVMPSDGTQGTVSVNCMA